MKLLHNFLEFAKRRLVRIEKRTRFALGCGLLCLLMLFSTFFSFDKAWLFLPLLICASYVFAYFAILEGIEKNEWVLLFLMPVLITVSFYLFYFLFPVRWLTRVPFIILFGISYYAILLCVNIFNVGVEKSLALYRAAFSVNFFYQSLIAYLLFNNFFSFKFNFLINAILIGGATFLLALQLLWTIRLKHEWEPDVVKFGFLSSLILSQLAAVLSFVPLTGSIFALFLSASYYSLAGVIYHYLDERLFKETIREYLVVLGFVFTIMFLSITW